MLICPQCQFENPKNNQFCQKCGHSLTHITCPECQTDVPVSAEMCPNCQTFTGKVWWAIVAQPIIEKQESSGADKESPSPSSEETLSSTSEPYLDLGRRYRVIFKDNDEGMNPMPSPTGWVYCQGKVIDCQPLQKSVLQVLLDEQEGLLPKTENSEESEQTLHQSIAIPRLALPYLKLREFYPTIPEIHEAWQEGSKEVILLPDRSSWPLLSDVWQQQDLPILQIVYLLDQMTTLWESLTKMGYSQSLLVSSNLRLDEDQTFGLQQLYQNLPDTELTLKDLGKMWQDLFKQRENQSQPDILTDVLDKLMNGEIETVPQMSFQLQAIADLQQPEWSEFDSEIPAQKLGFVPTAGEEDKTAELSETFTDTAVEEDLSTAMIPMQLLSLTDAGYTDNGRQRRHNEDCFGLKSQIKKQKGNRGQKVEARGLYIVCDGMGGHASGEVASAMAVERLQRYFASNWGEEFPDQQTINQGIFLANQEIYELNQKKHSLGNQRMGTTLVMALIEDTKLAIAHVGDSRIYRFNRKWGLEQLTVDHEVGQRAIQAGAVPKLAYSRPDAYQLTQALGPHDNNYVKPDIRFFDLQEDTLILLCSDGLSDNSLIETHYETYLAPLLSSSTNLEQGLRELIALGNQENGHDNLTAILIRLKVQPTLDPPLLF